MLFLSFTNFILLNFLAYVIRDGWPGWKPFLTAKNAPSWLISLSTQLARISGSVVSATGCFLFTQDWHFSALFFIATLGDFYLDSKHGEGQSATSWKDCMYLTISGLTSVPLFAILYVAWFFHWQYALYAVVLGLTKPPIWFLDWLIFLPKDKVWAQPTRMSAGFFGIMIAICTILVWQNV